MKVNAPEKIYVEFRHPFGNEFTEMLGFEHRGNSDDIEYIRKDAFIEKACDWLRNNSHNYANNALGKEYLVNDFKEYIEGE